MMNQRRDVVQSGYNWFYGFYRSSGLGCFSVFTGLAGIDHVSRLFHPHKERGKEKKKNQK